MAPRPQNPRTEQTPQERAIEAHLAKQAASRQDELATKMLACRGDVADVLAEAAYELVGPCAERLQVPDEDLSFVAAVALGAVGEVAQAHGIEVDGRVIAHAMQIMALRFFTEAGIANPRLRRAILRVDHKRVGAALDRQRLERGA